MSRIAHRRTPLIAVALLALSFIASISDAQQVTSRSTRRGVGGRYAMVNGLKMYYEVRGRGGVPLVLMHGAFSNISTDFGKMIATLAKNRMVVAIEAQGHGHTPDMDSALTYEGMADRTAELLRQLRIEKADLMGYSMGGATAVYVAVRHPQLVRKIIFIGGASYKPEGFYSELLEGEKKMTAADLAGTPWQKAYARMAPNPGDWPKLVEKIKQMDLTWQGLRDEDLRSIKSPALLIVGDADVVRPEHVVQMLRLLGGGAPGDIVGLPRSQLAVLPGTTHVTIITRTDWLMSMITPFLAAK
jgi:pimeloyl-ACP methyl ester carboxylesterase